MENVEPPAGPTPTPLTEAGVAPDPATTISTEAPGSLKRERSPEQKRTAMANLHKAHAATRAIGRRIPPRDQITLDNLPDSHVTKKGIDWNGMRMKFISGHMSLVDLAREHAVGVKSIRYHSATGNWFKLRAEWQARAQQKILERQTNLIVDNSIHRYEELEALAKHIRLQISKKDEQGNIKLLAPDMIQRLANSLDAIIKNQRLILGQSTSNVKMVDGLVDKIFSIVEKYVPEQDRGRLADEFSRVIDTTAVVGPAQETTDAGRAA